MPTPTVRRYTQALTAQIIICTSVTGLTNLTSIFGNDIKILLKKPLVVLSLRIKNYALSLGFQEVLVSEDTDDHSIMRQLMNMIGRVSKGIYKT